MLKHDFDGKMTSDFKGQHDLTSIGEEGLLNKKIEMENFTNMVDYRADNKTRSKGRYLETPQSDRLSNNASGG